MVDIAFLAVPVVIAIVVVLRKTSAGVAVLALLAGVTLDQLLTTWIMDQLPEGTSVASDFLPLAIRLLVSFAPMVASLIAVKVHKHNMILSLLTSLLLGFLVVYFICGITDDLPEVSKFMDQSGLLSFVLPYRNMIIAFSSVLAIVEMISSHRVGSKHSKKKKKDKD